MHSKCIDKEMLLRELDRFKNIIKPEHFESFVEKWAVVREKTYEEIIQIIEDFRNFDGEK